MKRLKQSSKSVFPGPNTNLMEPIMPFKVLSRRSTGEQTLRWSAEQEETMSCQRKRSRGSLESRPEAFRLF